MKILDVAWLAGLMEGEGSFFLTGGQPKMSLLMSDEDVVARAAAIIGTKHRGPYGPYGASTKKTWQLTITNSRAAQWMMTLYVFMGERRKQKIEELLTHWKGQQMVRPGRAPKCHPERKYSAKGLCNPCYMKRYHDANTRG